MMKILKFILVLSGVIGFILPRMSWADDKKEGIIKLEQIVVTATKTEKKVEDAPGSLTIISREEIDRRNIKTV
ncbi:MAG: hypothetical protein JRJ77_15490, partial [Deltaproteobacteria bacterium]|nr:hypothetical protein [Deltaproteobacteria bacterium]